MSTVTSAATPSSAPSPPVAEQRPHVTQLHGHEIRDEYFWLHDKADPKAIAYLEAENAYTDALTADTKSFQDALYQEMLSRIQQTDLSVPYRKGSYLYYSRTEEGKQYPIHCRKRGEEGDEQVMLDLNQLAQGHSFMALGSADVSPDENLLAYTTDSTGYRQYVLHVKDLGTGADLPVTAERVTSVAWTADSKALFYTEEDAVSKRSYRLHRRALDAPAAGLVDEEKDERFDVEVERSRSGVWLLYTVASHTTSEVRVLPADHPERAWLTLAPRQAGIEYYADHRGDSFWIRVNDTGRNYRLVTAATAAPDRAHWHEVIPHRPEVMLSGVSCFAGHVVLLERENALPQITVMNPETRATRRVSFPEVAYTAGPGANPEFATPAYRYGYQSFLTPASVYDLDLTTFESKLLKRQPVLGGWDPSHYVIERIEATAKDGVRVPITLVHRKDTPRDGSAACLLYAYGSYGFPSNVLFNSNRFSLLDRGVVYALAHIRGGGDKGKAWHDDGRMTKKMNTFTDFIACGEHLVSQKVCSQNRLVIQGGSAGGLLMGAVANLRPDLWKGVFAQVPFVDVITTMLDESLPLTVGEFEEWGNPKLEPEYDSLRAYSPYDNISPQAYPAMLVKTSLNDSQVGYWEAAKYVARLRANRTDASRLLLKCNLGAGHGGAARRAATTRCTTWRSTTPGCWA